MSNIEAIFPANSLQQGFIYQVLLDPSDDIYCIQSIFEYHYSLDITCFRSAWDLILKTYPILRTCFNWDEIPLQIIMKQGQLNLVEHDISSKKNKISAIASIQKKDKAIAFDLTQPTLLRLNLIKQSNTHYTLLKTFHHIITDAWSESILLQKLHDYYITLIHNRKVLTFHDSAYLHAQEYITKNQYSAQEYWKKKIENINYTSDPNLFYSTKMLSTQKAKQSKENSINIEGTEHQKLKNIAQSERITISSFFQFAWHKILNVYTRDIQTTVGTTVSGRSLPIENIEQSVGLYINTLPCVVNWENSVSIKDTLIFIQNQQIEFNDYCYVYLSSIQPEGERLFHTLFVFEHWQFLEPSIDSSYLPTVSLQAVTQRSEYPIMLTIYEYTNYFSIKITYDNNCISDEKSEQLLILMLHILQQLPAILHLPHHAIHLLTAHDYQQVIYDWNDTFSFYPEDKTIGLLFEEQVTRTPHHVAVTYDNCMVTYEELNHLANQVAHYIRKQDVAHTPEGLITLCLERSIEMIIGILGILKAGFAYVPIEPDSPETKIRYILKDTKSVLLLTQTRWIEMLSPIVHDKMKMIALDESPYRYEAIDNLQIVIHPTDLAYVMYTSGTTGQPKGVLITHNGVVNRIDWMQHTYPITHSDVILHKTPYGFDVSVWELLWAIWYGARIVIAKPFGHHDADYLLKVIQEHAITVIHFVPSMLSAFIQMMHITKQTLPTTLRHVFCSGEILAEKLMRSFYSLNHNNHSVALHNLYGPTEASIDVTHYSCQPDSKIVYIGKPIQNTQLYVLDTNQNPVPIGAIGELYIGGVGLARGYLNQIELTNNHFIANPFAADQKGLRELPRLYKSGDLVRWDQNGNLIYVGREDHQIKIRGVRVELRDIENALLLHPSVTQVAIVPHTRKNTDAEDINVYLIAYYTSNAAVGEQALRLLATKVLPHYMIPSLFIKVDSFSLNANGKLDLKALHDPELYVHEDPYVAPSTSLERALCEIWQCILGVKLIGVKHDFYRLGGDSILSIRLAAEMQQIGFPTTVREIFLHKSIKNLIDNAHQETTNESEILQPFSLIDKNTKKQTFDVIKSGSIEDIYPASYLQIGMLLESLKTPSLGIYHDVFVYKINCIFDEALFLEGLQSLIDKHPLLRTSFLEHPQYGYVCIQFESIEATSRYHGVRFEEILHFIDNEKSSPLSTDSPGLFRLFILNPTKNNFSLVFSFHHAITDGWSMASLVTEFLSIYNHEPQKDVKRCIPLYQQFIAKEKSTFTDDYRDFWMKYLENYEYATPSFTNHLTCVKDVSLLTQTRFLSNQDAKAMLILSKRLAVSPDKIFLALYFLTLATFSNQQDMIVGIVTNNRIEEYGGDQVFGLHLNTLPLRMFIELSHYAEIEEFIAQVNHQILYTSEYKRYPYGKIKSDLKLSNDLYYAAFNFIHFHITDHYQQMGIMTPQHIFERTTVPMTLNVIRDQNDFCMEIKALNNLIDADMLTCLFDYLSYYLACLLHKKPLLYMQSTLLPEEYQKVIYTWNNTKKVYPAHKTIHQLFEEQVQRTPHHIALVCQNLHLTYQSLNHTANQLAHFIRQKYQPDQNQDANHLVVLCMDRSLEMFICIFAVLKAGYAYVPIDPGCPAERIRHIFQETQSRLLLTQTKLRPKLNPITPEHVCVLEWEQCNYQIESSENLYKGSSNNLAYVIYTSGTTGLPKGVMIEHRQVNNYYTNVCPYFKNILCVDFSTNIAFDLSITTTLVPLLCGKTIFIYTDSLQDFSKYSQHLVRSNIDFIKSTPSYLSQLCTLSLPFTIKQCFVGGERFEDAHMKHIAGYVNDIYDEYGPTETTVGALLIKKSDLPNISIGKPYANYKAYILNHHQQPVPIGVIGELYIGGAGVGRGYLNQPELTQISFIDNPFIDKIEEEDNKLYKTGDLARWLPNGELAYIGRKDRQVKLRGYRIELVEVEQVLSTHPLIQQSIALLISKENLSDIHQTLIACYVSNEPLVHEELLSYLVQYLPEYMLPSSFLHMTSFPLTSHGKIDRKAMTALAERNTFLNVYIAPRNELEAAICHIWQTALGIQCIGIEDDFIKLGGDSLCAIQVAHRINQLSDLNINAVNILQLKTISTLVKNMKSFSPLATIKPSPDSITRLSFAQERLWFIEHLDGGSDTYHISIVFELTAEEPMEVLITALNAVIDRHEILRTVFTIDEAGITWQTVLDAPTPVIYHQVPNQTELSRAMHVNARAPFVLNRDYPLRVSVFCCKETGNQSLLITIHHIAGDGWSGVIFRDELFNHYNRLIENTPFQLTPMPLQYKDFSVWQRHTFSNTENTSLINYWKLNLKNFEPLQLPLDYSRPFRTSSPGVEAELQLSTQLFDQLTIFSKQNGVTVYTVALSAFALLLSTYTQQTDLVIGTPMANREHPALANIIGFFVNLIVLRIQIDPRFTAEQLVLYIHRKIIEAHLHQDLPFDYLVELLNISRDISKHPLVQVTFQYKKDEIPSSHNTKLKHRLLDNVHANSKFDLSVVLDERADGLYIVANYAADLFAPDTIERLIKHYEQALVKLTSCIGKSILPISLLTAEEYQTIIYDWNKTHHIYPDDKTIQQLFEEQAQNYPQQVAVQHDNNSLTYDKLNQFANQIAQYIRRIQPQQEISPNTYIAICLEHSIELVISILGTLKAGGIYVPIDPGTPNSRIQFILKDLNCNLLITDQILASRIEQLISNNTKILVIDTFIYQTVRLDNSPNHIQPADPAYVLYTSGTTGKPKGVIVPHQAVNRLVRSSNYIKINESDRILFSSSIGFDGSTFQIWGALLNGARLTLIAQDILFDVVKLGEFLKQQCITIIAMVSSLFNQFVVKDASIFRYLSYLILGGEVVSPKHIRQLIACPAGYPKHILSAYGPTENTTFSSTYLIESLNVDMTSIPIGRPISNTFIYVLNSDLSPAPIGVIGELYLGGAGLALGYINQPELTKASFIDNPYATETDLITGYKKLYKTGDLGKWLPNGELEYIGRNDTQVKIHGLRIELQEIEHTMLQIPGISEAIVVYNNQNNKKLIAYFSKNKDFELPDLTQTLSTFLPRYMIPSHFICLTEMPLTPNGKIDKSALPSPELKNHLSITPPTHQNEQFLINLWSTVLPPCDIGIHNNFFDLGGNSILLMQIFHLLPPDIKVKLKLVDLFTYPTINTLNQHLASLNNIDSPKKTIINIPKICSDIAVIGMAGRFVQADDLDSFWQQLRAGECSTSFYTDEELHAVGINPQLLQQKNYVKAQSKLDNVMCFDASFFGFSPKEAEMMDPQHRIFMECVWHALEDANYNARNYSGEIGLYATCGQNNYLNDITSNRTLTELELFSVMVKNNPSSLTSKIAYNFNLTGPAITIETACSSSLVAIHQACNALLLGDCEMAIAGGISIDSFKKQGYLYEPNFIRSMDGYCRPFDKEASGTFSGQGVGVVVLKSLQKAISDNDHIYAVIKATAINNDGRQKVGFMAPSVEKQASVILKALQKANIQADQISYIEAHGTGTLLGDPIEVEALIKAFQPIASKTQFCALGSVKSNLGHLGEASGIAGFIKTVLCVYHRELVPTLHYTTSNSQINFQSSPFYVNTETKSWSDKQPLRAGVSSFGLGGTNAHVIIEEAPAFENSQPIHKTSWHIVTISAHTANALSNQINQFLTWLSNNQLANMTALAYTLQVARPILKHSLVFVVQNTKMLKNLLLEQKNVIISRKLKLTIAFVFYEKKSFFFEKAQSYYYQQPIYQKIINQCLSRLSSLLTHTIKIESLCANKDDKVISSLALFIFEYALAKFYIELGIQPTYILGQDIGELVCACLEDRMSLENAFKHIQKHRNVTEKLIFPSLNDLPENTVIINMGFDRLNTNLPPSLKIKYDIYHTECSLYRSIGELGAMGAQIDWKLFYQLHDKSRLQLPKYPFEKNSYQISEPHHPIVNAINKDVKSKLIAIWQKLFGLDVISEQKDFFDLGADSLMAIQLTSAIIKEFSCSLDLASLGSISITTLTNYITSQSTLTKKSSIIKMQSGFSDNKLPLILIHPIGGDLYFYRDMCQCMPKDQTIIGIRAPSSNIHARFDRVEDIATYYINMLNEQNIYPPYILGGSSFGGIVAFEMAQQLQTNLSYPPCVIMIDSPYHQNLPRHKTDTEILEYVVKEILKDVITIKPGELEDQIGLENKIAFIEARIKAGENFNEYAELILFDSLQICKINWHCMEKYQAKPYDGNVVFFSPLENMTDMPAGQSILWNSLVNGKFESFDIPGNHITMNQKPNVRNIIGTLIELRVFLGMVECAHVI
ncbi:MAG: amino acid adenylation domain-containing protein [Legionellaceae bacterium]|nr:amino acid adenylation domain-containing protein [Legionellaceae bacterium]